MVALRFVDDAVPAKKFVVVALVPVALTKVKFWRVEDELTRRFRVVRSVVEAFIPLKTVTNRLVDVAEVVVESVAKVDEAMSERGDPLNQRAVVVELTVWPA